MTSKARQRVLWMAPEMNIDRFHSFSVTITSMCVCACVCVFIRLIIQNEQSASLASVHYCGNAEVRSVLGSPVSTVDDDDS